MLGNKGLLRRMVRRVVKDTLEKHWVPLAPEDLAARCGWVLSLEEGKRNLRVRNRTEMERPEVASRLVAMSYELRHADPAESLRIAVAAVDAAENLPLPAELRFLLPDFQAQAWGNLANCQRLAEAYDEAEVSWATAEERLKASTGDLQLRARLRKLKAALRRDQTRFGEAHTLYLEAAELNEKIENRPEAGKDRLGLAINHFYAGNTTAALDEALRAGKLINPREEPEMALALYHNTLLFFEDAGQYFMAEMVFPAVEGWYGELGSPLTMYRAYWLKCRLHLAQNHPKTALRYGEWSRRGFLAEGQAYDAALCGFDVAFARMQLGGFQQVQKMAEQMYPVFTSKGIPREAAATLLLFADAARRGQLSLAVMRRWAAELKPLRRPGGAPASAQPAG